MHKNNIEFRINEIFVNDLKNLPWNIQLEDWDTNEIKFLNFRKGISRHPVKFVKSEKSSFAIKQTTKMMAEIEIKNYNDVLKLGIHSLIPAGYVVTENPQIKVQTKIGSSFIKDETAFVITVLEFKALPDSYLYKLNFKDENRKLIWNAIAELLAKLHFNNIYWGDASLANILVKFIKVKDEKGRVRTELKAVLADAETLKILPKISKEIRKDELSFFFESMTWLNQDFKQAGYIRENFSTSSDKKYILKKYFQHYKLLKGIKLFEDITGLNVAKDFKGVTDLGALKSIRKQIDEHKWYLSEQKNEGVSLKEASQKWLEEVYKPIIKEFEKLNIFEYFPFKTPANLYIDVMTHKYYLSLNKGNDVGIEKAILDFSKKYASNILILNLIKKSIKIIKELFY
ncbi:MAG: DUF4032 domain-containing protein [Ignavibacteriaceae bacterium]